MSDYFTIDTLIGLLKEDYVPKKPCNAEKFILSIEEEDKPKKEITIEELLDMIN